MTKQTNKLHFAEILEAKITTFQAQSWQWDTIPEFGSLIAATSNNRTIFGIIYDISTGPMDPIRTPIPYQKTEKELEKEQPQIFEFLKTSFQCLSAGYLENNKIFYHLPPQPPKIHTFVCNTTKDQYDLFFESPDFLHLIFNATEQFNLDELLLAIIKQQISYKTLTKKRLDIFIEAFFYLNKNDYQQTKLFLNRLQAIIQFNNL